MRQVENGPSGSIAAEHLDKMFAELDCAARIVRDNCDPARLAARHPLGAAAHAMGLGFFAARQLSKKMPEQEAPAAEPQASRGGIPWGTLLQVALSVAPLLMPKPPQPAEPAPCAQPAEDAS